MCRPTDGVDPSIPPACCCCCCCKEGIRCKIALPRLPHTHPLGLLRGLLLLHVLVGTKGSETAEEHDEVEADAETGALGVGGGRDGTGEGRLGLGVAGLGIGR